MNINKIDQFRYLLPEDHQVKKQVTIKIRQAAQLIVLYDDGTHFYYRAKAHLKVHQMLQTLFKYIDESRDLNEISAPESFREDPEWLLIKSQLQQFIKRV